MQSGFFLYVTLITMLKQVIKRCKTIRVMNYKTQHPRGSYYIAKPVLPRAFGGGTSNGRRVPSGYFAVYVGQERRRFLVPTRFLNLPIFKALLEKAEEEYGLNISGGISLPCEVDFFKRVLEFLDKYEKKYGGLEAHEFLKVMIPEVEVSSFVQSSSSPPPPLPPPPSSSSSCSWSAEGLKGRIYSMDDNELRPLMQKART